MLLLLSSVALPLSPTFTVPQHKPGSVGAGLLRFSNLAGMRRHGLDEESPYASNGGRGASKSKGAPEEKKKKPKSPSRKRKKTKHRAKQ